MSRAIAARDLSDSVAHAFLHSRTKRLSIGRISHVFRKIVDGAMRSIDRIVHFFKKSVRMHTRVHAKSTSFAPVALMMYGITFASVLLASLWFALFLAV